MKPGRRFLHGQYGNILRKILIHIFSDFFRTFPSAAPEADDLPRCMNPRIGPSGTMNLHRCAFHPGQKRLQLPLNCVFRISLYLPAAVTGSWLTHFPPVLKALNSHTGCSCHMLPLLSVLFSALLVFLFCIGLP